MLVRGARRGVDEEVVQGRPERVGEKLADHGCLFGAAPDDGGGAGGEEEGEGEGMKGADFRLQGFGGLVFFFSVAAICGGAGGVGFVLRLRLQLRREGGEGLRGVHETGEPAAGSLGDASGFEAEEAGDGGASEVDVEDADGFAGEGEGEGELGCYGGLADAAFAREDEDDVLDVGEGHGWGGKGETRREDMIEVVVVKKIVKPRSYVIFESRVVDVNRLVKLGGTIIEIVHVILRLIMLPMPLSYFFPAAFS